MSEHSHSTGSSKPLLAAIVVILLAYIVCAIFGWPQEAAKMIGEAEHGHVAHAASDAGHEADHAAAGEAEHKEAKPESEAAQTEEADHEHGKEAEKVFELEEKMSEEGAVAQPGTAYEEDEDKAPSPPPIWMVVPFVLLLGSIAILPLIPATEEWWESNMNRFIVAAGLGFITLLYYLLFHQHPIDGHFPIHYVMQPSETGLNWGQAITVLMNAFLSEYIPFIMLLFALYTISGGIRISGDLKAHAVTNSTFIAIGGLLASFVGTTGAAMLLIRPLLETNKERKHVVHTVIFFIFVVCNCGGCLLPIGDPPLFLGYLRGVPFTWTFNLWMEWLFLNGMLITMYFLIDHFWYYPKELPLDVALDETRSTGIKIEGLLPNALLLLGVIFAVALLDPHKPFPGTDWRPWMFMREAVQLIMVMLSLWLGKHKVRVENNFNYHAIIEVAALFIGIFICMQPALQILGVYGPDLGLKTPMAFFWATGSLSSVLDNAPTYVVFFDTAQSLPHVEGMKYVAGVPEHMLVAISLGAVFMGAMTYIGNGPNFMVKAIAEKSGVKMPSFFGYIAWSCAFLLPLLILTCVLFL